MDVLSPPIIKIRNKLFRKNPTRSATSEILPVGHLEEEFDAIDVEADSEIEVDHVCHIVGRIESRPDGFVAQLYVPPVFYGFIIGAKHAKQSELQTEFSCKLKIPDLRSSSSHIQVSAKTEANIRGVFNRIKWIISKSRPQMRPTHFICLPGTNEALRDAYVSFKKEVLELVERDNERAYRGIDADLFVSEHKLHFTLATLFLADQREVKLASQLLTTFMDTTEEGKAFDRTPLRLTIRGFDTMNDDPRSARVLYMTLHENAQSRRLQSLANGLADLYTRNGLHSGNRRIGDPVKLHMTVLNSRLRAERQRSRFSADGAVSLPSEPSSEPFSAIGLLSAYETRRVIENVQFEEVQLCKLLADDSEDQGNSFYPCVAKLCLTT
ncbi:unnamed protein product [Mesocestoides corti]|uniref:AKAP7_NLS domain-containing protein n=2 Tax=Mesocestoides corti TaxID=53468 RepID=A0A0R3U239_MESCO|nr:unnamed protein product [Mesocestoides corti]